MVLSSIATFASMRCKPWRDFELYVSLTQLKEAIHILRSVNPFFGITYLVCKRARLPIGTTQNFQLDAATRQFMQENHRLHPDSETFFQPFHSSKNGKWWVSRTYPSSGLQSLNTRKFFSAFLHSKGERLWGWQPNYIEILVPHLSGEKIPAWHLALWIYRGLNWPAGTTASTILETFLSEYDITEEEQESLFNVDVPDYAPDLLAETMVTWRDLAPFFPRPDDAEPPRGGSLASLETIGIGPAEHLRMDPGDRLTLITGDNGLGKSFLLDCAWWALTGSWADRPFWPHGNHAAEVIFRIQGTIPDSESTTVRFNHERQEWMEPESRPTIPGLTVYARADGAFAIWDPVRHAVRSDNRRTFTNQQIWDGYPTQIEGLIRDWVSWQRGASDLFQLFAQVLKRLSPPDLGPLEAGDPERIPGDSREIPTIRYPFGTQPIIYASSGIQRIVSIAYLIVWAWKEHIIAAKQRHTEPESRLVVLIDELEAHLHPQWQRTVLPALMEASNILSNSLQVQYILTTHSPLVMASAEPIFDPDRDQLFHFALSRTTGTVSLHEVDFIQLGDAAKWLTSPVFEMKQARSVEAEQAIEDAKRLQLDDHPSQEAVNEVSKRLVRYLAEDDAFWPRWVGFAEKFGVEL